MVAVLAMVALVVTASSGAVSAADGCGRFSPGTVTGNVKTKKLTEISGVVASRRHPGVYWTHNDSGGKPEVFALGLDGADLGAYPLTGASATDWEDIAIGPAHGAGGSYLYLGDIGDNAAEAPGLLGPTRPNIVIYRVAEPAAAPVAPGAALAGVERFTLKYPESPHDAEAMFVDPISGDLVIVTKSPIGMSHVMVVPAAAMVDGAALTMTDTGTIQIIPPVVVSTFPGTWVTGADISPDGSLILLRTYQQVLAWTRTPGQSTSAALQSQSCVAPSVKEGQGEAVAIAADMSRYITISEGLNQPVNSFAIASAPVAASAAPPTTAAPTKVGGEVLVRSGGAATLPLAFAMAAVLMVAFRRLTASPRS